MIKLKNTLASWNTADFRNTFKQEAGQLSIENLLLQQALLTGSYAIKDNLQIMINSTIEEKHHIIINTGIFYSSVIAGCNCSDDPTPVDINSEYCEVRFSIDKLNAQTIITITS